MTVLLAALIAAFAIFVVMIGIILGSGTIEGRLPPQKQGRP